MVSNNLNIPSIDSNTNFRNQYPSMGIQDPYANRIKASQDTTPQELLMYSLPIFYGINVGMDRFNAHCANPDYNKTIFGKIEALGRRIEGTPGNRTAVGKALDTVAAGWNKGLNYLKGKSDIIKHLAEVTAKPENPFAKMPWGGMVAFTEADVKSCFEKFLEPIVEMDKKGKLCFNATRLEQYGTLPVNYKSLTGEQVLDYEINKLNEALGRKNAVIPKNAADKIKLIESLKHEVLGFDANKLKGLKPEAKSALIKKELEKTLENFMKDPKKYAGKALSKCGATFFWHEGGIKGFFSHIGGRIVKFQEYINKARALKGGSGSRIADFLNKSLAWISEGCTNRFAGGKVMVLIQALIFGDMLAHIIKAPKGEKLKTTAERGVNDFSYFLGSTVVLQALFKIGGLKYMGNTADEVKAYEAAHKAFNEKNKAKGFATEAEYLLEQAKKEAMLKKPTKWYQKILAGIGNLVDIGNGVDGAYRKPGNGLVKVGNGLRRFFSKKTITNIIGVPLRLIPVVFMLTPLFAKMMTKGENMVFGKPTHSVLDEGEEEENPNDVDEKIRHTAQVDPRYYQQNTMSQPRYAQPSMQTYMNQGPRTQAQQQVAYMQYPGATMQSFQSSRPNVNSRPVEKQQTEQDLTAFNDALKNVDKTQQRVQDFLNS